MPRDVWTRCDRPVGSSTSFVMRARRKAISSAFSRGSRPYTWRPRAVIPRNALPIRPFSLPPHVGGKPFLLNPLVTCYHHALRIIELTSQSAPESPPLSTAQSSDVSRKSARIDRREEILDAATKLFAEHGYAD